MTYRCANNDHDRTGRARVELTVDSADSTRATAQQDLSKLLAFPWCVQNEYPIDPLTLSSVRRGADHTDVVKVYAAWPVSDRSSTEHGRQADGATYQLCEKTVEMVSSLFR